LAASTPRPHLPVPHLPVLADASTPVSGESVVRQSIHLGRVSGIDIGAHWSVLFIAALLGYGLTTAVLPTGAPGRPLVAYILVAIVVAALFLAALLAHELAHALVARRHGVGVRGITLWLLGGVSELDGDPPTPRAAFLIAASGPATSLVIGGVAAGLAALLETAAQATGAVQLLIVALAWLAGVNLLLGVFNLLPGAPLDGGRIVHAVVWKLRGDSDRAQIAADHAGVVLGVLIIAVGLFQTIFARNLSGLWLVLLGWFLTTAANAETASVRMNRALDRRRVRDIMATAPVAGHLDERVDTFIAETVLPHPHDSYPVLDDAGRPVGIVYLSDIARIDPAERPRMALRAALAPDAAVPTVTPDDPALVAARNLTPSNPLVAVTDDERLVGVVASSDVAHALALAGLGPDGPARRDRPQGSPDRG
jgi:Zn-dependent protease/CBS domain-containing protein